MNRLSFIGLYAIQLAIILLLAVLYPTKIFIFLGLIAVAFAVMSYYAKPMYGFIALSTGIACVGFLFVLISWIAPTGLELQALFIAKHMAITVLYTTTWLTATFTRRMVLQYRQAIERVQRLEKYTMTQGVLTVNEFQYRLDDVYTGARRRGEGAYVLFLRVVNDQRSFQLVDTLVAQLERAALQSVRSKFDIVGKLADDTIGLVLQNTDARGVSIVTDRFFHLLSEQLNAKATEMLEISSYHLIDQWGEIVRLLEAYYPRGTFVDRSAL
ncbi:hypothetical protein AAC03nite_24460 [Alicyclobacillus acidoterrestris]|nr:hypothetical protein AAC03nite_24460 [Alicyclobacillus acidoterrestris]